MDVLIVDDNKFWIDKIIDVLDIFGCNFYYVHSYIEALKALEDKASYALAVIDIRLIDKQGNKDGLDLLKMMSVQYPDIDVIVITGYGTEDDEKFASKHRNLVKFIHKQNFDIFEFRNLVKNTLRKIQMSEYDKGGVLIVDDNWEWLSNIEEIIHSDKVPIYTAENIDNSKQILSTRKISVLIIDICLHGDNVTIADRLFWDFINRDYPELPKIAISGKSLSPEDVWELRNLKFLDFYYKPSIRINDFRRNVSNLVGVVTSQPVEELTDDGRETVFSTGEATFEQVSGKVKKGKLLEAINLLLSIYSNDSAKLIEVIMLSARYNWFQEQITNGLISKKDEGVMFNEIAISILKVCNDDK